MFKDMFTPCLVQVYTIFEETFYEDMFTQRQPVDVIFSKCLNPYPFKIDQNVLFVENG